jgi:hypothetical protein
MLNRKGRLSSFLFAGLLLLPLMGLMFMDYEVKTANDVTGAYVYSYDAVEGSKIGGMFLLGLAVVGVIIFAVRRSRASSAAKFQDLAKINDNIKRVESELGKL